MTSFNTDDLRATLSPFDPLTPFDGEGVWLDYHNLYGLTSCVHDYHYSMGITVQDDTELVVQYFSPTADLLSAKGTVVLMHGYMDHVGLYDKLIRHVLDQGWALLSYDLPGHGLSSGPSHSIEHFSQYAIQLEQVLAHHTVLASPIVLLGQSTGGAIILEHHRLFGDQIDTVASNKPALSHNIAHRILLAPLIRPKQYRTIQLKYHFLHFFLDRVKRFYTPNSHDAEFTRFIRDEDPLQKTWVSVDWVGAMLEWVSAIESWRPSHTHATVIQGTDDQTVDWEHNLMVLTSIYPEISVQKVTDARHNLANEDAEWRDIIFNEISTVLDSIPPDQ